MLNRIISFSNLTLLVALSLSSVAAWYSIIGLTAIFAGAVIPVIIMGSILEVGKITTTVWLRKYWHRASWVLKLYLVPAVIALALLTSMGIFGFLSKAHMDQGITSGDVQAKIAIYDEKIKTAQDNIDVNRKALKQLDEAVDQVMGRSTSETGADKAVAIRKSQAKERTRLLAEIATEQQTITGLREERAPIAAEVRKVEAEVGPIKYIAALIYGDNADTNMLEAAVRWVIILLVIVFDPLAIALVLAANASKEWDKEEPVKEEPKYEPDDGPLTEEQLEQIKETVKQDVSELEVTEEEEEAFKDLEPIPEVTESSVNVCYMCGTELVNAPGIGSFCPNKQCDVLDNTEGVVWELITSMPEKTLIEQHPYLTKGFAHFTDLTPMVATTEVKEPEEEIKEEVQVDDAVLEVYNDERLVSNFDKKELTVDSTQKIDIETEGVTKPKPFKELEGGYVSFEGKHMHRDVLKGDRPDLFKLVADSARSANTSFGTEFPKIAEKGDTFVRVDVLPNRVYKFDGSRWIMVNKETSKSYLHDQEYIKYLVTKIESGEYDIELLNESEKQQIEEYLTKKS
jgi:hypothetical protein